MVIFWVWPEMISRPVTSSEKVTSLVVGEVVMGDDSQDGFVALTEEAWSGEADDEIFADDDARDCAAGFTIVGHGADGGAPGGERSG